MRDELKCWNTLGYFYQSVLLMFCSKLDQLSDCLQCHTGAANCSTGMGMSKCVWEPPESHFHHRKWEMGKRVFMKIL